MRPQPLNLVIERYRHLRDDSVVVQSRVAAEFAAARHTLQTLEQYRLEQHQRSRNARQDLVSVTHLLLQTRFSGKLEEAIAMQAQRLAEIGARVEVCRAQVLHDQQRLKAIETIASRRAALAHSKAVRADQAATDERAADAHAAEHRQTIDLARRPFNHN